MSERMRKRNAYDGPLGVRKPRRAVLFPGDLGHAKAFSTLLWPISSADPVLGVVSRATSAATFNYSSSDGCHPKMLDKSQRRNCAPSEDRKKVYPFLARPYSTLVGQRSSLCLIGSFYFSNDSVF